MCIIGLLAATRTEPNGEQTAPATAGRGPPLASSWKPTSTRHRSCHRRHPLRPRPRNLVPRGRPDWQIAAWPWPRTQVGRTVHGRRDHRFGFHVLWSSTHTRRPGQKTASPGISKHIIIGSPSMSTNLVKAADNIIIMAYVDGPTEV